MSDVIDVNMLKKELNSFVQMRDWAQFHNPKNLAMSVACEAGELMEIFQWMTSADSKNAFSDPLVKEKTEHEIADIILYAIRLADLMHININESIYRKLKINNAKYPVGSVKGSVAQYNDNHS